MKSNITLTGIKPTGVPHIGNYLGAIRPALDALQAATKDQLFLYFIADYHSLTSHKEAGVINQHVYDVAATWLACGLDPEKVIFYRQSDIPEILELMWILTCYTPKGDLNRAHAYKAMVAQNAELGREDADHGVNAGVYLYPILMAADILLFHANNVPVGHDQRQHVEMARSIAQRINQFYKKELLVEPKEVIGKEVATIIGLDGRKMSKSYDNTIPLFVDDGKMKKLINKIKTDSSGPTDPKDPETSPIFQIYAAFNKNQSDVEAMKQKFLKGISWGEAKEELLSVMSNELKDKREKYNYYMNNKKEIEKLLEQGAVKAKVLARQNLAKLKDIMIYG